MNVCTHCIDNSGQHMAGNIDTSILQADHDRVNHGDKVSSNIH